MNEFDHNNAHDDCDLVQLVRAAGTYIEPSRDLRPRTLEAAREARRGFDAKACIISFLVALSLTFFIVDDWLSTPPTSAPSLRTDADHLSWVSSRSLLQEPINSF